MPFTNRRILLSNHLQPTIKFYVMEIFSTNFNQAHFIIFLDDASISSLPKCAHLKKGF